MKATKTKQKSKKSCRRILTVVGAAVVFLTFVVKESIRDYIRDLKDSLSAADSLFTLEDDINNIGLHLVRLDEEITANSIKQQINTVKTSTDYSAEIRNTVALMQVRDSALHSDFDRIKRLVDKMPSGAREATRDNFSRMDELLSKFDDETKRKAEQFENGPHDAATLERAQVDLLLLMTADTPILIMGSGILDVARQQEERLDRLHSRYAFIAFVLYVIGWGLGLYGALSGASAGLEE